MKPITVLREYFNVTLRKYLKYRETFEIEIYERKISLLAQTNQLINKPRCDTPKLGIQVTTDEDVRSTTRSIIGPRYITSELGEKILKDEKIRDNLVRVLSDHMKKIYQTDGVVSLDVHSYLITISWLSPDPVYQLDMALHAEIAVHLGQIDLIAYSRALWPEIKGNIYFWRMMMTLRFPKMLVKDTRGCSLEDIYFYIINHPVLCDNTRNTPFMGVPDKIHNYLIGNNLINITRVWPRFLLEDTSMIDDDIIIRLLIELPDIEPTTLDKFFEKNVNNTDFLLKVLRYPAKRIPIFSAIRKLFKQDDWLPNAEVFYLCEELALKFIFEPIPMVNVVSSIMNIKSEISEEFIRDVLTRCGGFSFNSQYNLWHLDMARYQPEKVRLVAYKIILELYSDRLDAMSVSEIMEVIEK
jgi:hypothetical protein